MITSYLGGRVLLFALSRITAFKLATMASDGSFLTSTVVLNELSIARQTTLVRPPGRGHPADRGSSVPLGRPAHDRVRPRSGATSRTTDPPAVTQPTGRPERTCAKGQRHPASPPF